MSYLDPPEENAPTFCPVCLTDDWVDVNEELAQLVNSIPLLTKLKPVEERICCSNCGLSLDYLNDHVELYHKLAELEPDIEPDDYDLTPEEVAELQEAAQEAQTQKLIEAGYLTKEGDPTDAYYRESDFQYDCWRERR